MLKNAPIVILGEAAAYTDPENERELIDAVEALTKEKTISIPYFSEVLGRTPPEKFKLFLAVVKILLAFYRFTLFYKFFHKGIIRLSVI